MFTKYKPVTRVTTYKKVTDWEGIWNLFLWVASFFGLYTICAYKFPAIFS